MGEHRNRCILTGYGTNGYSHKMDEVDMQQVIKHGYAAVDGENLAGQIAYALQQR